MKYKLLSSLLFCALFNISYGQNTGFIKLDSARFNTGNQAEWKDPGFNDASWKYIRTGEVWQTQGYANYHGYAWYRIHVFIPALLKKNAFWRDSLRIFLAHVNDVDESYLNGKKIGKIGSFPEDKLGYVSKWPAERSYSLAVNDSAIHWDAENVIAVKVYDGGGTGGIFMGSPYIDMLEKTDGISFEPGKINFLPALKAQQKMVLKNRFNTTVDGTFHYKIIDVAAHRTIQDLNAHIAIGESREVEFTLNFPHREGIEITYEFTEKLSGKTVSFHEIAPYILTPPAPLKPLINGPAVLGAEPQHPILYKIPATGASPLSYDAVNLPKGLYIDRQSGIVSGSIMHIGNYRITLIVRNKLGFNTKSFEIKIGHTLALTPPMGWNSWNCWGLNVSAEKVKSSADAMLKKGLAGYGWAYINIDDGWQDDDRNSNGEIRPNQKFPNMSSLGKYLHANGLKFGIYSSPGIKTCGGFTGSLGHEAQDADSYASWGVDYLKYDLCSYTDVIGLDTGLAIQQKPYIKMRNELKRQSRDILYSICQYGIHNVWKWGKQMNGNSWRTTEDITDTWESMYAIGFNQDTLSKYAGPGGWNDPDMLIVGNVGWGESLHPSQLNPYEQYTHISLWCMLSAPLLIGCDMSKLDEFTLNLLKNPEVIAIDQDELGRQAKKISDKNNFQVWVKPLADGSHIIGIFNINNHYSTYNFRLKDVGINAQSTVKDVWRQKDLGKHLKEITFNIPPHGVRLIKIYGD